MLRDSLGMRLVTQTLLGPSRQVVVQGNYAYVGVSCGLLILDVSDPAQPVEMGRAYDVNFTIIEDLFVQNGYAYLVDAYNGLAIVDVRDVRNPRMAGRVRCGYHMHGVFVKDTLAYVVGSGGFQDSSDFFVINVEEPTAPLVVAGYDTSWGSKIQVVDTLAYVAGAGWTSDLEVFNVRDPFAVRKVGRCTGLGGTMDLVIRDTLAYFAALDSGLCIVNIKDPKAPQKVKCYHLSGLYVEPWRITVLNNYAYLCEYWDAYQLAYDYPLSNLSHLWVVDISDPFNPFERGVFSSPGSGGDVFARDSLVFWADGGRGLRVMDVRVPSQPREVTHYPTGDACWELVKQGNYLYVAHGGDGLRVLDIRNPAQSVEVGHLEMPWRTFDIVLKDSLLYAAEGDSGLVVVDIRNPALPSVLGRWSLGYLGRPLSVAVQDTLVYLSGGGYGSWNLWIVSVADPRNPTYIGRWGTTGSTAYDLYLRGRYAIVVGDFNYGSQSYMVVDVGDPRNPQDIYQWAWPAYYREAEGVDNLLYGIGGGIMEILSVGNPVNPDTGGWYSRYPAGDDEGYGLHYFTPGFVWVGWHTYYFQTVEHCGRVDLLDVRNPHPARSIAHYETGWTISDVWGEDLNYAYGGAYLGNLFVFRVDSSVGVEQGAGSRSASRKAELEIRPNPIRGNGYIRYWFGNEGKIRLTLYDVTGRVVRSFAPHALRLTPYEVYWDGRDDQGKEVRSGVYFLRAEGGGQTLTRKMVVVR
jgi:hypothetical protein